jgi:hypothetical protein
MWKACVLADIKLVLNSIYAMAEKMLSQWRGRTPQPQRKIYLPVTGLAGQRIRLCLWHVKLRAELYVVFLNASLVQVTGNGFSSSLYGQCTMRWQSSYEYTWKSEHFEVYKNYKENSQLSSTWTCSQGDVFTRKSFHSAKFPALDKL